MDDVTCDAVLGECKGSSAAAAPVCSGVVCVGFAAAADAATAASGVGIVEAWATNRVEDN